MRRKYTKRRSTPNEERASEPVKSDSIRRTQNIDNFKFKINCRFKNKKQKEMYNAILNNRITFVRSVAGTGKTYIALLAALEMIKNPDFNIDQIVLTKPIVEITSNKGLGALPGDLNEKTSVYFSHFYDNLNKLIGEKSIKYLKEAGYLKECVLNYMRGSTFGSYSEDGSPIGNVCIFDEAQNCTAKEMKAFISRMGEGTKLIIIGDSDQIDIKLAYDEYCGLDDAIYKLADLPGISVIEFDEDDIVRDPFLIEIMKRYKEQD